MKRNMEQEVKLFLNYPYECNALKLIQYTLSKNLPNLSILFLQYFKTLYPYSIKIKEILGFIGTERAQKVERLLDFGNDKAGGLMRTGFISFDGNITVKEAYNSLYKNTPKPEAILVTNGNQRIVGTIRVKDILDVDSLAILKDIVGDRKFVYPDSDFNQIISLFGRYNLRVLPVVDKDKKPIGVITAGIVLSKIEERIKENANEYI